MSRARTVVIGENVGKEVKHFTVVFISWWLGQKHRKREQEEKKPKYRICPTYMSGLSEDLRRILRRFAIRAAFTTVSTLRPQLTRVKAVDPPLSKAGVVYRVPCSYGKEYFCENKRTLGTCIKQHQSATRRRETEKCAIAEHAWAEQHCPK